jgi:hypothetical protein
MPRLATNGSFASPDEQAKVLGGAYHLVVVDEAASHRQDLRAFCDDIVGPACDEVDGTICLIGTPGNVDGYFKAVTTGEAPDWSVHRWTYEDNPYTREAIRKRVAHMKRVTPGIELTPGFRQMYLAEWVIDDEARVYKFDPKRNGALTLDRPDGWRRVLGLDFGFIDDTAYVVLAWREGSHELFVEYAYKEKQTDFTLVAQRVAQLMEDYEPYAIVADYASRQGVEELRNRHELPLERADKGGKQDMIRLMNCDLLVGRLKVLPQGQMLAEEWQELVYDEVARKQGILKPHPACADHLAAAALYAWRRCYQYASRPEGEKAPSRAPPSGSTSRRTRPPSAATPPGRSATRGTSTTARTLTPTGEHLPAMKIETLDDLDRLLALVCKHEVEELTVGESPCARRTTSPSRRSASRTTTRRTTTSTPTTRRQGIDWPSPSLRPKCEPSLDMLPLRPTLSVRSGMGPGHVAF